MMIYSICPVTAKYIKIFQDKCLLRENLLQNGLSLDLQYIDTVWIDNKKKFVIYTAPEVDFS
jgi:hypothetical protein